MFKKSIITLIILAFISNISFAQADSFVKIKPTPKFFKGDVELKAAIGVLPTHHGKVKQILSPSLFFGADLTVTKKISLGAFVSHSKTLGEVEEYRDGSAYQSTNQTYAIGIRAQGNFIAMPRLKVYGGLSIANYYSNIERNTLQETKNNPDLDPHLGDQDVIVPTPYNPNPDNNKIIVGGYVGANYYISPSISVFAEVGYSTSIASVGLGYKF